MKRLIFLLACLPLLLSACAAPPPLPSPSAAPSLPPPTPVLTQPPTGAPTLPAATVTLASIQGTLTVQVNVRSGPGMGYAALAQANAGQKMQVLLQDATGKWYQVLYPSAPGGVAWVAAQYVQLPTGAQVPPEATPTPEGPAGRALQQLNVRSGPGLSFPSLGMLAPDTPVSLTGKDATAAWFQIAYPPAPGGRAWVTSQYIQTDSAGDLPVLDEYGTPIPSGTPGIAPSPAPVTPSLGPAYADGDSAANPGASVTFSASGTRRFTYSSQVSAPQGDPEDWVAFTPFTSLGATARLLFSLACTGNGTLTVELWQGGAPLSGWGALACGDTDTLITLPAAQPYEVHLLPAPGAGLRLVNYVLTVENLP
ncbi:MAG: SH3 domain-containing protein [Anaerolineales bacterium]